MPVVGIFIKSIEARRYADKIKNLEVKNNTKIENVKQHEIQVLEKNGLDIEFNFTTEYKDDAKKIAEISVSGNLYFIDDNCEKAIEVWQKENKLPDEINLEIINNILRKCFIKSIILSEELQLPSPVPLPYAVKER